jgi:hypothetical protein
MSGANECIRHAPIEKAAALHARNEDSMMAGRRRYTMDQYRADVAKLYSIRKSDAPGVSALLSEALRGRCRAR